MIIFTVCNPVIYCYFICGTEDTTEPNLFVIALFTFYMELLLLEEVFAEQSTCVLEFSKLPLYQKAFQREVFVCKMENP